MYAIDAPQSISKNMSTDEKSFEYITYGKIVDRKNYSTRFGSETRYAALHAYKYVQRHYRKYAAKKTVERDQRTCT